MLGMMGAKWKQKWGFALCLFGGVLLLSLVLCSHPLLKQDVENELLRRDFNSYAEEKHAYPAVLTKRESREVSSLEEALGAMEESLGKWKKSLPLGLRASRCDMVYVEAGGQSNLQGNIGFVSLLFSDGCEEHSKSIMQAEEKVPEGFYKCRISEAAMDTLGLVPGEELTFSGITDGRGKPLRLYVGEVFADTASEGDAFWYRGHAGTDKVLFLPREEMEACMEQFGERQVSMAVAAVFDDGEITWKNASGCLQAAAALQKEEDIDISLIQLLYTQREESRRIGQIMWVLELPVVVLVLFFIHMVTGQMLRQEEREMAMLYSRGMTKWQIVKLYLAQAAYLFPAAFLPVFVGIFVTFPDILSGILHTLPYALAAWGITGIFMAAPVFFRLHSPSREKVRSTRPFWRRFGLDFILLGAAMYLLYNYSKQQESLARDILEGNALDPLLFLDEALFIFAGGLVAIRIFMGVIRLIARAGNRWWSPAVFAALRQSTAMGSMENYLASFLIMTIACGIFDMNMAQTIYQNIGEQAVYDVGCDFRVSEDFFCRSWLKEDGSFRYSYSEPDVLPYEELVQDGVCEGYTRVLVDDRVEAASGVGAVPDCELLGIHTREFGETAELFVERKGAEWYNALNALAEEPDGVILSDNLAKALSVKMGDSIKYSRYSPGNQEEISGSLPATVCAIVDSFPGYCRYQEDGTQKNLIVANYGRIQQEFDLTPYEIWGKLKEGQSVDGVEGYLEEKGRAVNQVQSLEEERDTRRREPLVEVTNRLFVMSFCIFLLLCVMGFLICWCLSIQGRAHSFGIYRAMGLGMGEIYKMLVCEQVAGSALPMLTGCLVGLLATRLFVGLLSVVYLPRKHSLDLKVYWNMPGLWGIMALLAVVFVACLLLVLWLVKKMKIVKSIKLGEDGR